MLSTTNLAIQFEAKPLFEHVSVKFSDGNRYGLIGANGSGKSTLMKILGGELEQSAGDVVLQAFAQCVKSTLRASDLVCRMGGEEFAAILPDTPAGEALVVAKRLRNAIAALPIAHQDHTIPITVSIGVASLSPACRELSELIRHADQALYQAKAKGRNRVCVAESL